MVGAEPSVAASPRPGTRQAATTLVAGGLVACAIVCGFQAAFDHASGVSIVLAVAAVAAGAAVVPTVGRGSVSPSYIVVLLAAAFLGPVSAAVAGLIAEAIASRRLSTTAGGTAMNVLAMVAPGLIVGNILRLVAPHHEDAPGFYALIAAAGILFLILNFTIVSLWLRAARGDHNLTPRLFWKYLPALLLNTVLAVAGAAIFVKVGVPGMAFALAALFTFSYMAHLLEQSRQRAEQYVSLSWGVLAGLMRAIDVRDQRAARHAAAVARFARDMAAEVGMSEREQELAHTAGLLHDIGHFALSDRVHEHARTLNDEDWEAIQRHPQLGADMLKDLGVYGPVAEIVLAHHERVDGRGYPSALSAEEIPEIAKIISVAEVYDTLTAQDTYRTRISSFEALTELRRVAGTQLDAHYVEVLAGLLSGEGVEYRHADAADFDTELNMERRIREARTG